MDEDMHQGHEPEHVDLTHIEGEPGARVDPLFERQTDDAQFAARWFRARFYSDTPVRSPTGIATALLKLVLAAGLPAAGMAARANRDETGERHTRHHTKPTRRHKALQLPRRR